MKVHVHVHVLLHLLESTSVLLHLIDRATCILTIPVRPLVDLHVPVLNLLEVPVLEYDLNLASSTTAQYKVTTSSWTRLAQYTAKSY